MLRVRGRFSLPVQCPTPNRACRPPRPIRSRIVSLHTEKNSLQFAVPGGLIGVGTRIDPTLCRADRMVGQVLGTTGNLPKIYTELEIQVRACCGLHYMGGKKHQFCH